MDKPICKTLYVVRSSLNADLDVATVLALKAQGVKIISGNDPINHFEQLLSGRLRSFSGNEANPVTPVSKASSSNVAFINKRAKQAADDLNVTMMNESILISGMSNVADAIALTATEAKTNNFGPQSCQDVEMVCLSDSNSDASGNLNSSPAEATIVPTTTKPDIQITPPMSTPTAAASKTAETPVMCKLSQEDKTPLPPPRIVKTADITYTNASVPMALQVQPQSAGAKMRKQLYDLVPKDTLFLFGDFVGSLFVDLQKRISELHREKRYHWGIIGLPALKHFLQEDYRPVYNWNFLCNVLMKDLYVYFDLHRSSNESHKMKEKVDLLKYMGGYCKEYESIKAKYHQHDVPSRSIFFVSNRTGGPKYRFAIMSGIPVMTTDWIGNAWINRSMENFCVDTPEMIERYKLPPFSGLHLAFFNFPDGDMDELRDLTTKNGGNFVELKNLNKDLVKRCTHLVIDAIPEEPVDLTSELLSSLNKTVKVVYKEWFWASLEMAARADESNSSHEYPTQGCRYNGQRSMELRSESRNHSCDRILSPMLDYSNDSMLDPSFNDSKNIIKSPLPQPSFMSDEEKKKAKRKNICFELLQTEKNYLEILHTIINIFYKPLLESQPNKEPLLNSTERTIIFGNLPRINDVHTKICADLQKTIENWSDNCCIGNIFLRHYDELLKAYPPFVNYFENTKDTLTTCDENYPRFHAFLKRCQSRPECKRQSLVELLIRPVQRLPSISLLLRDILNNTPESNADKQSLNLALDKIGEVLKHINEDKRKTEGQMTLFEIVNDMEDCPPPLLSSNREFICKSDAKIFMRSENNAAPQPKRHAFTLFLFNDVLVVCKKRSVQRSNSLVNKNQSILGSTGSKQSNKKRYRHIDTLDLIAIKQIYQFSSNQQDQNAIAILAKPLDIEARSYSTYPFLLEDKECKFEFFIEKLCQKALLLQQPGKMDRSDFLHKATLKEMAGIDFEHACKLSESVNKHKLTSKVKRAMSTRMAGSRKIVTNLNLSVSESTPQLFNHTYNPTPPTPLPTINSPNPSPRRNTMHRALSSIFNVNLGSPFNSLASMRRMSSTTSLNELSENTTHDNTFSCPTTPAPRKKKCSQLIHN